jgi:hypothetical protein
MTSEKYAAEPKTNFTGSHNSKIKQALSLIERRALDANSDKDLVSAIELLAGFPEPVCFDNSRLNLICGGIGLITAVGALATYLTDSPQEVYFITGIIAVIVTAAYVGIRLNRRSNFSRLSDNIHYKSTLNDYGLSEISVSPKAKARELGARFKSFNMGNHLREIRRLLSGTFNGKEHSFQYQHFHFHYVIKRRETYTTTDSKGRTRIRTRTVYDRYNRYGFIVPFSFARNIHVSESALQLFSSGWKSSSVSFNKRFSVQAQNEMDAAKFLKPKVLIEIEAAGKALGDLSLEFTGAEELCFSFTNNNTIAPNRRNGLENPKAFAEEIKGHNEQPALDAALNFIHTLMKYSDSNFETRNRGNN